MSASFDDTVFSFDLNLFTPNNSSAETNDEATTVARLDKQRKAVAIVKRKITATNTLIKRYYDKRASLEQLEKNLLSSKDECKQICIDYRNSLDTCTKLENDIQVIQATNKQLEEKCFNAVSQYEALQSHSHQLQMLVKDHEETIETLKATKKVEKSGTSKDFDRKLQAFEKRNSTLLKHVHIFTKILLGKKKLTRKNKVLLERYEKLSHGNTSETSQDEDSDGHDDIDQHCPSPYSSFGSPQHNFEIPKATEVDSEATSVDTGRGSSLASSNNHSPEYFLTNSPEGNIEHKINVKTRTVGCSPIPNIPMERESATSPVKAIVDKKQKILKHTTATNTSPKKAAKSVAVNTSPTKKITKNVATSPIAKQADKKEQQTATQEKECLEKNSSNNIQVDAHTEFEIEMILDVMRWDRLPVTPIPETPLRPVEHENSTINRKHLDAETDIRCQGALLVREENKKMLAHIDHLAKEINFIKKTLHKNNIDLDMNEDTLYDTPPMNDVSEPINHDDDSNMDEFGEYYMPEERALSVEEQVKPGPVLLPPNVFDTNETEIAQNNDTSRIQIIFEPETSCDGNEDVNETETCLPTKEKEIISPTSTKTRINKKGKLSKLGKFKKTLKPKYKIKTAMSQSSTKVNKSRKLELQKPIPQRDSAALLNDKAVYEKAVKVMAELKKENANAKRTSPRKSILIKNTKAKVLCDETLKTGQDDCSVNLSKQNIESNTNHKDLDAENGKPECQKPEDETNKSNLPEESITKTLRKISTRSQMEINKSLRSTEDNHQEESLSLEDSHLTKKTLKRTSENTSPLRRSESSFNKCLEDTDINIVPTKRFTRSSRKAYEKIDLSSEAVEKDNSKITEAQANSDVTNIESPSRSRKRRISSVSSEVQPKRVLRSTKLQTQLNEDSSKQNTSPESNSDILNADAKDINQDSSVLHTLPNHLNNDDDLVTYDDINIFSENNVPQKEVSKKCEEEEKEKLDRVEKENESEHVEETYNNPKDSIICKMIAKYGVNSVRQHTRKTSEAAIKNIHTKLEQDIEKIIELNCDKSKESMNALVEDLLTLNYKDFVTGLMTYLRQPQRKIELYGKHSVPPAPPITKSEQVLLYVLSQIKIKWPEIDIVDVVLRSIEYTLFQLNRTPEFDTIETMSHFYAVVCKYFRAKSRLRMFILDAMYCMQFKAIPVVKECLDVWTHIIPLAHMGTAKNPLVTVMVYLLHFYKCEDRQNRVQDIRHILHRKYFYKMSEWNDTKILDTVRNAIKDLRDIPMEKKMLRMALIILGKRQGPRWCQNKLITNILQPLLDKESVTENIREFCISMIGPLMKPYPADMKIHCEIAITQLAGIMKQNASLRIQEAAIKSMMLINRHDQYTVNHILFTTKMDISPDLEETLRFYIKSRPIKVWKSTLERLIQN